MSLACPVCHCIACVCAFLPGRSDARSAAIDPGPGATLGDRALLLLAELRSSAVSWDAACVGAFVVVPVDLVRRIDAVVDDAGSVARSEATAAADPTADESKADHG